MSALSFPRSLRLPQHPQEAASLPRAEPGRLRVGLLGGSFNPAHAGHRYISLEALRRLDLDQVWWLVSPQNPLKPKAGMAPLPERMRRAVQVAAHARIKVLAIESRFNTRYTVDTLRRLNAWRDTAFVFLIGADNLAQLPRWRHWRQLVETCPVAVFERHPYSYPALVGPAASALAAARLPEARSRELAAATPAAWVFVRLRPHPASATALRASRAAGSPQGERSSPTTAPPHPSSTS